MGESTGIGWTSATWNPWRGCTMVSPGCALCYMFTEQRRYGRDPSVVVRTKTWGDPLKWQRQAEAAGERRLVFTCSWSDWFHEDADPWRDEAWEVVRRCPNLTFQILTKRDDRIADHLPTGWGAGWPNVWLGVSVENRKHGLPRVETLRHIPASLRFLSVEPLLEDLGAVDLSGVGWVIVGGESGSGARPFNIAWARSMLRQCRAAATPCFIKQLGAAVRWNGNGESFPPSVRVSEAPGGPGAQHAFAAALRQSHGADWSEWPRDIRVREFPT